MLHLIKYFKAFHILDICITNLLLLKFISIASSEKLLLWKPVGAKDWSTQRADTLLVLINL